MTLKPTDFRGLLHRLLDAQVEFVLVGGVAGIVHGSARATFDIDVVYARAVENIHRTLETSLGDIDLLGEITGGGAYEELLPATVVVDLFDLRCRCVTLEKLIHLKRAAGRPKDFEVIAELEAIAEERRR